MALVLANRVQETGTANTTVSFTLSGATAGYQSFAAVGNGNTTFYAATDGSGNWEVGLGTYSTTGPTLTRTTVYASSNAGSAVTFSGGVTVFVTYPSGRSVNLDASGNVSALGTIASGTWQGSTVGVAYGGTGVTSSSGANSVMLRDASQNVAANNFLPGYVAVTAAGTTTVLTVASAYYQRLSGATTQTFQLPDATTLQNGHAFVFDNDSSGTLTIVDNASGAVDTIPSGGYGYIFLENNSTSAGSWGKYALLPANYDFSTTSANFGAATISNATYNGNTIGTAYGGTGLTSFTTNGAVYATGTSTLTTGTLPVSGGGTGVTTTPTNGQLLIGNGSTYTVASLGSGTGISTTTGAGTLQINNTGVTSFSAGTTGLTPSTGTTGAVTLAGTLAVANGGSGATTAQGAMNTFAGAVTSGSYLRGNGTNVVMSTIQAADVPTLNQNTTGTASNVTGTVAVANGGTGLTTAPTNGQLLIGNGTNYTLAALSAGTGITITNGAGSINIASSVSAVTSVTGTSPVVSSGGTTPAISLASGYGDTQNPYASKTANYFLAAPNGLAGVPTFRAIVAADIPTLNQNTTGSAGSVTNAVTFNNGGAGAVSGTTYNGSAAQTISYNTVGASPLAGSSSLTTTGTVTSGTWSASFGAVSGANLTNITGANVTGTVSSATTATNVAGGALGSVLYQSAAGTTALLAGNTTSTKQFLVQTGTGTVSAAPAWGSIAASDVPTLNQNTTGTAANITASSNTTLTSLANLATVGTIGTGTWQASVIGSTYGGTGVNNAGRTFTINTNSGTISYTLAATTLTVANNASVSGTNTGDQTITLTGDVTGSGTGSFATTLATVNSNTGSFGSSTAVPVITVNGKGLITAVSTATVSAASAGGAVYENSQTISSNYTMTTGYNGVSAGPITVSTGITVTIPTGSSWSVV